jgi:hypothetical protein
MGYFSLLKAVDFDDEADDASVVAANKGIVTKEAIEFCCSCCC